MNDIRHLFALVLQCLALLVPRHSSAGNLAGFDEESKTYIRGETGLFDATGLTKVRPFRVNELQMFRWLMPFCSDLAPYLEQRTMGTPQYIAKIACMHFQKEWLPDGWTQKTLKNEYPNDERGGFRKYRRVPNTICPVFTQPNGSPVYLFVWEHRRGGVNVSMLLCPSSMTEVVIVVHKDNGLGPVNPSPEDLVKLGTHYFHLPPEGMLVPKDWSPLFEVSQRDGRFTSGKFSGDYSGKWEESVPAPSDSTRGGSWGEGKFRNSSGRFFYDGFNLAMLVTPINKGGVARTEGPAISPRDIDWDAVEKREQQEQLKK